MDIHYFMTKNGEENDERLDPKRTSLYRRKQAGKKHVLIEGDRIEKIVPADHALDVDPARTRIIEAEGQLL